nr:retrovirus-related Pol polyprotein from transposon TNT 1-94 [Tanacetum cinerariifolium]
MHKAFPLPAIKFPLPEELPTASEDGSHCQKKRDATSRKIALLSMSRRNCQSKMAVTLNSYEVPANDPSTTTTNTTSGKAGTKSGRTVTLTTEDMQKKKNYVKARTTLLLSLPNEHQLQFRVILTTSVSRPQLKSNPIGNRVMRNSSQGKKLEVEDQSRNVKLPKNKTSVTTCNDSLNAKTLYVKSVSATCDKCVLIEKHDVCVLKSVAKPHKETVASKSNKKPRNFTRKLYERVSKTCKWWYPKFTPSGYTWKPKSGKENVNPNVSMPLGNASRTANVMDTMTSRRSTVSNTPLSSSSFAARRDCPIHRLNHNLFSVGQFCDADLEVAFRKSTCYIRDLKGNDLLTGSRGTDLYSIKLQDTNSPNPICLMAKATSSQAWLWHRRLSHLNFDTINLLSKNDIVVGLPKLKFVKDHLCSSCELGKAKRKSFHTKLTPSSKRWLHLLHMNLCGPMRVTSINGKIYVLVIVDDYSRYTWTHFLRSKDETPEVLIDFLRLVQRGLQAQVRIVRTDKGTEFLNQTLHAYFTAEGILHQTSVARTPKQNGIVERQNRTLVEAARTMLSAAKEKGDECIFVGYSTQSRAYRVFNKRTRVIMESIHVNFDELPHMASDHISSDPAPEYRTVTTSNELDLLFSLMFDELLNGSSKVVSNSSAISAADAPFQHQIHTTPLNNHTKPAPTCQVTTLAPTVISSENINQAETYAENDQKVLKELVKNQVKEQVSRILPRIVESVNATLEAEVLTRSSQSSRTSYAIAADLSEMELKKILIEKMEGNKSIQRSDEQRNLYKALVEAYEADKAILDTYGDSTILKQRREDDDQEGPSAGSNRGSKRQKEGGEQASARTPSEKATEGGGGSTTGS